MALKPETRFWQNRMKPDLEKLPNTWFVKIQMVGKRGIPDVLLCINGLFVALEAKKDGVSLPDPLQEYTLKKIAEANGIALVVHPDNWGSTLTLLREFACK